MLPGPVTRSTGSQARCPAGVPRAVGEHRDGLGAADGVHLVDAEQRAGGQDRGVGKALEARRVLALRGARHGDRTDPRLLRRDDVHDHAARVDGQAAGHVEADAPDGHPALGHRCRPGTTGVGDTGRDLVGDAPAGRAGSTPPGPRGRRVEALQRADQRLGRDADPRGPDAVEVLGEVEERLDAAGPNGLAERTDRLDGVLHVERRARDDAAQGSGTQGLAAQVDSPDHPVESRHPERVAPGRRSGARRPGAAV